MNRSRGADRVAPARRAAYEVLRRVFEHDAWADRVLPAALRRHRVEDRDRALAQRLAYGSVQRRGTADAVIERLAGRPAERLDPPLVAALRLGLYELLFSSAGADYAAVDQAVELAKGSPEGRRGSGLVNAVLRRAARDPDAALEVPGGDEGPDGAALVHSHPLWIARMWWAELGPERARSVMAAGNEASETALRANLLRTEPPELLAALLEAGVEAKPASGPPPLDVPELLVVRGGLGPAGTAIERGEALPQSRASAAAVALLDPRPGERVLDLCAGPGIKTTQIAARMEGRGELVSVEVDPGRGRAVGELASAVGAGNVQVLVADATSDDLGSGYDRVLVDAPCSDLGTLASRPDARWRKDPAAVERLAGVQRRILERGARALRPGGTLVYSTCTISRAENEDQVATFARDAGGRLRADELGGEFPLLASSADRRFLQTLPDRDRTDGFFLARLRAEG